MHNLHTLTMPYVARIPSTGMHRKKKWNLHSKSNAIVTRAECGSRTNAMGRRQLIRGDNSSAFLWTCLKTQDLRFFVNELSHVLLQYTFFVLGIGRVVQNGITYVQLSAVTLFVSLFLPSSKMWLLILSAKLFNGGEARASLSDESYSLFPFFNSAREINADLNVKCINSCHWNVASFCNFTRIC